jgi:hypothetical protein
VKRYVVLTTWVAVLLVCGCACTQEKNASQSPPGVKAKAVQVDPMVFVMLYRTNFEGLLKKHQGDCDGALAALMVFIADHRQAFQDKVKGKPLDWQPGESRSQTSIDLLMEFGASCPSQVARLNQAIHTVTDTPESLKQ